METPYGASAGDGILEAFLEAMGAPTMEWEWETTPVAVWTKILFVLYTVMTVLLLLNLIIAIFTQVLEVCPCAWCPEPWRRVAAFHPPSSPLPPSRTRRCGDAM